MQLMSFSEIVVISGGASCYPTFNLTRSDDCVDAAPGNGKGWLVKFLDGYDALCVRCQMDERFWIHAGDTASCMPGQQLTLAFGSGKDGGFCSGTTSKYGA